MSKEPSREVVDLNKALWELYNYDVPTLVTDTMIEAITQRMERIKSILKVVKRLKNRNRNPTCAGRKKIQEKVMESVALLSDTTLSKEDQEELSKLEEEIIEGYDHLLNRLDILFRAVRFMSPQENKIYVHELGTAVNLKKIYIKDYKYFINKVLNDK